MCVFKKSLAYCRQKCIVSCAISKHQPLRGHTIPLTRLHARNSICRILVFNKSVLYYIDQIISRVTIKLTPALTTIDHPAFPDRIFFFYWQNAHFYVLQEKKTNRTDLMSVNPRQQLFLVTHRLLGVNWGPSVIRSHEVHLFSKGGG